MTSANLTTSAGFSRLSFLILSVVLLSGRLTSAGMEPDPDKRIQLQEIQMRRLVEARRKCVKMILNATEPSDGPYCEPVFDNIMCWPFTKAGTVASMPCPGTIANFNPLGYATRVCEENGTWGPPPPDVIRNSSTVLPQNGWTNFTACNMQPTSPIMPRAVPGIIKEHMPVITLISKVGYSISLVFLVVAIGIMVKLKRLHCQRNVIHINLFVTFLLRAVIGLLRDSLLVQGLGLVKDVQYDEDGKIEFNPNGPHWECKLIFTLFHWALVSNYMWIFVEGLYLHTLIFFAVFDQKAIFKWYIIFGWVMPFVVMIPWVMARIFHNDTLCWNTHEQGLYWILEAPIIISICVNFFFFLNIIRVLFTKLRATATGDAQRYRQFAKSTLVLIPLFGVYYIFFIIINPQSHVDPGLEVGLFYAEMTLNSFQGTVVTMIFCFTNGEVRSELAKRWQRQMLRRQSVVSLRSSRAMSTTSFFFKERGSISQAQTPGGAPRRSSKFPNVDSSVSLRSMESANGMLIGGGGGGGMWWKGRSDSRGLTAESPQRTGDRAGMTKTASGRELRLLVPSCESSSPNGGAVRAGCNNGGVKRLGFPAVDSKLSLRSMDSGNVENCIPNTTVTTSTDITGSDNSPASFKKRISGGSSNSNSGVPSNNAVSDVSKSASVHNGKLSQNGGVGAAEEPRGSSPASSRPAAVKNGGTASVGVSVSRLPGGLKPDRLEEEDTADCADLSEAASLENTPMLDADAIRF